VALYSPHLSKFSLELENEMPRRPNIKATSSLKGKIAKGSSKSTTNKLKPLVKQQLLRQGSLEKIRESLILAGAAAAADAFLSNVDKYAEYLDRCSSEAELVLKGSLAAANRLWLRLGSTAGLTGAAPTYNAAGAVSSRSSFVVEGKTLFRLVAGITRAANQPSEAELMLENLGRLLEPIFTLDLVASAIESARQGSSEQLETLVTAQLAPRWLASLGSVPVRDQVLTIPHSTVADTSTRSSFDLDSWSHKVTSTVDHWGLYSPCAGGVHNAMSEIDRWGARYHIDTISPVGACAGQKLTITGTGFGTPGRVTFPSPDANDPIFDFGLPEGVVMGVEPIRWTDTSIEVIVPEWATAGEMQLSAFVRHTDPCVTIDVYRLGNTEFFKGGLASVYQVSLDGVDVSLTDPDPVSLPLRSVTLSWHTSGGPGTVVGITITKNKTVLVDQQNLPGGFGSITISIPVTNPQIPEAGTITFTAMGPCGETKPLVIPVWISVPPVLTICQYRLKFPHNSG
jgi:hypothetical protein